MVDPVASAIASAGVSSEPSSVHSVPIKHATVLDDYDTSLGEGSSSSARKARPAHNQTTSKDDQGDDDDDDDEDGPVVFDARDVLMGPATPRKEKKGSTERHHRRKSSNTNSPGSAAMSLGRASLESFTFGYRDHLLPLTLSGDDGWEEGSRLDGYGEVEGSRGLSGGRGGGGGGGGGGSSGGKIRRDERSTGLIDGIALTVGLQIGSGIFSSPGVVTINTGSIGASMIVWLMSGVLAWTGASSFAELGAAIPLNGGAQAYLNYSFGPLMAYLFSWSAIVCLKPGSGAIIATIFGEYLARVVYHSISSTTSDPHEQGLNGIPDWSIKLLAVLVVVAITLLNVLSAKLGTRTQIATTIVKLIALIAVPILAIVKVARGGMPEASKVAFSSLPNLFKGSASRPSSYALALYSGLWAFDGWDQTSYVAGEMKNVNRDLPRVIHSSLSIVVVMFLTTVVSYFLVLPPDLVSHTNTVALDFGSAIAGTTGGVVFAILVAFSCFGALNGQFYTSSRLVFAAGREGYLPQLFGRLNPRTKTPLAATLLQSVLVIMFVLFGSGFASLINFYGVCAWFFYFVTVLGLLYLRIKEPNLERPYQTWISTPILFSAVALFLLFMPIFSAPLEALAAFIFILTGIPMYYATQASGRETISQIPGMSSLVGFLRTFIGKTNNANLPGRGGDGGNLFGRRKVTRNSKSNSNTLDNLDEEEEEGEEEEAVQMLPRENV
ncbi:hypothetical protein CBS101457_006733 [Exobasidium rhododendri]|nr:hypothetical protein CBS101457_006733 [Exobasidium rhododendri]